MESIGQGGMGRVWRAADAVLDRSVAIKEIRIGGRGPEDPEDARTRRERTLREARATARIDHPNVVRVYDVVDEGERLWIVMELVAGRSLERIIAEQGPLGPREAARTGLGLVAALCQVHARGVLHRDIKPGNVLIEAAGQRVVLTDFGIAAIQDAKALTMVGMLVGSPDYMAPERVSGRPQGPPSDLWSLGATLAAALSGSSPFSRGTTLATLHAVLHEEPRIPAAAGPLRPVLTALLAKDPDARPTLDDLEAALRPLAHPEQSPTVTLTRPAPPHPPQPQPHSPAPPVASPPVVSPPVVSPPVVSPPVVSAPVAGAARPRVRRRVAVAAVVGAAAVAAVAAVALTATTSGPPHGDGRAPGGTATASAAPARSGASGGPASTGASGPATVEGTSRPPSLPPGARREAGGYAWVPPEGWRRDVKTGAEVHYTAPDGTQELVAKSALARGDLMETWRTSEQNAHQGRDYRKIRLAETEFRGRPAVVWEYTFTLGGVPWHARLLGFDQDGTSYQINTWYQPHAEPRALEVYEEVRDTFTVL